jgi:hypothetical protein
MLPKVPFVSNFMTSAIMSFGFSNYFLSMTIFVSDNSTYSPLILTSKGGRGNHQKLSIVKVSPIDLAFASMPNLLRCGTPLFGKVGTKNKEKIVYDLFFLLGHFALSNVAFYNGGFLNSIGFVTKPTKCENDNNLLKTTLNDNNLLKSTSHIALAKSEYYNRKTNLLIFAIQTQEKSSSLLNS